MNDLIIFNNSKFGEVRTIQENDKVLFCGSDIAKALGYSNPTKAIADHCRGTVTRRSNDSLGRRQDMSFVTEGDIYRLAARSSLPGAAEFESWIFDDVLPTLRKTGKYDVKKTKQARLGEANSAARIVSKVLKDAGVAPNYIAVATTRIYEQAGYEIPLIGLTAGKRTYDATTIAKMCGIMSFSGKPHALAISAIISTLDVADDEKVLVPYQNNESGHAGTTVQYSESVFNKVVGWLKKCGYPAEFKIGTQKYKVVYNKKAS